MQASAQTWESRRSGSRSSSGYLGRGGIYTIPFIHTGRGVKLGPNPAWMRGTGLVV